MSGLLGNCRMVPGMGERERLNLSFSMSSPLQREAWSFLSVVPPGRRIDAVCRAVCRMYGQELLLETVRQTIREELRGVEIISKKEKSEQPREAGDVGDDVLGFLSALQQEGDDMN